MKTNPRISRFFIPLPAVVLMCGLALCLAQPVMPPMDNVSFLKDALQAAEAPSLTAEQESSIRALIEAFRESHRVPAQNPAVQDARAAYENAILNGDIEEATTQAQTIGNAEANEMTQRQIDAASLAISIINVLKTGSGQIEALSAKMGAGPFVRLMLNMAGGPRGFGPPRRGPGPRPPILEP
ncbi:MAG: hypothetical protein JXA73_16580 [Acidobacteria bacterium]|nr:hypothetical protein [Acidobacteriota bacterium]